MIVVEKKPVPIYEVECCECHSKIQYKASEVHLCHIDCPLVPVPEHGRTIDADAFKKRMMQGAIDAREDALTDEIWLHILDAAKSLCLDIDEQPTIIPADKEGEG